MPSIVFQYNRKNVESVSLNAQPTENQSVYWSQIKYDIVVAPTNIPRNGYPLNTNMNVTTMIAADSVTTQETYTLNVSDRNNITIGSLQYIFNYENPAGNLTTGNISLNGKVFVANGVFAGLNDALVNQTFNNVTGDRVITITRRCGC
jgi:hypothetical protein